MGQGNVPAGPEELTIERLSTAMGTEIASFGHEQIGIGVGLLGRLFRLTMRTSDGQTLTAVAKFPTLDEGARMNVVEPLNFYEKEIRFYQEAADRTPIATPRVFAAEHDPDSRNFFLLLEDLCARRMCDQIAGCSIEDARVAVDALAALHAAWWEADFPAWLPAYFDPPYPQVLAGMYMQAWPRALEAFGDHLSPQMRDFGERYPEVIEWFTRELGHRPWTLCHGDYRLDNLFFATSAGDASVAALDWQICFRGRGGYDLAYFISQSLPTDVRRAHEASLKDRYAAALQGAGVEYPRDELDRDYALTVAYCFIYPVVSAGQIEMTNERMRDLVVQILDRAVVAIEDNEALALLS